MSQASLTSTFSTTNSFSVQDFSVSLNPENGLLEARGLLVDRMKKIRYFTGDLHSYDVMLFWGSLRQNIKDRIDAFL